MTVNFPDIMDVVDIVSIPFVTSFDYICEKLRKTKPSYTYVCEGGKIRCFVEIELDQSEGGQKNFLKVEGSVARKLETAMESAAEAGIKRLKLFKNFYINDVNFKDYIDVKEKLTQTEAENEGLKYELDLVRYNQSCMRNVYMDQIHGLEEKVAHLKGRLSIYEGSNETPMESDPSEPSSPSTGFFN